MEIARAKGCLATEENVEYDPGREDIAFLVVVLDYLTADDFRTDKTWCPASLVEAVLLTDKCGEAEVYDLDVVDLLFGL